MDRPEPSCEEAQGGRVRQVLQLECRDRNHDQSISEGAVSRRRIPLRARAEAVSIWHNMVFIVPIAVRLLGLLRQLEPDRGRDT